MSWYAPYRMRTKCESCKMTDAISITMYGQMIMSNNCKNVNVSNLFVQILTFGNVKACICVC